MTSAREASARTALGPRAGPDDRIPLPSLSIQGFRGFEDLSIPRLGRVTLLAGRNGVGKTTALDAVRIYASRAHLSVLVDLLASREEVAQGTDEKGASVPLFDAKTLFHGRDMSRGAHISIGPWDGTERLVIEVISLRGKSRSFTEDFFVKWKGEGTRVLKVTFRDSVKWLPTGPEYLSRELMGVLRSVEHEESIENAPPPEETSCQLLGPGPPGNRMVASFFDKVALTDYEDQAIRAVNLATNEEAARIAVVGDDAQSEQAPVGRRLVVRLKDGSQPVPLKSLGDGAVRLLGVALALANSRDGFLLIDEAENGIHHSVQRDFWRMVLQTARDNNVQVFATTHGWDCVRGFAQAAVELDSVEGVLVRLERRGDRIRAVEYLEEELIIAARQGIEVR